MAETSTHFVFVDFENVPTVDLGLVEGKAAQVTLLIGKNQKKIDLALVQQIRRLADQVELVEVGASGRNALDLTLAYYLGQAVQRNPAAEFFIVSKDKDFEPMIGHLAGKGIAVTRCDAFTGLPFLAAARKAMIAPFPPQPKAIAAAKSNAPVDRLAKLIGNFKGTPQHRPKKRATLLHHISTLFGNKLSDAEVVAIVDQLEKRRVISLDPKGRVTYH